MKIWLKTIMFLLAIPTLQNNVGFYYKRKRGVPETTQNAAAFLFFMLPFLFPFIFPLLFLHFLLQS